MYSPVTDTCTDEELEAVLFHIETFVPQSDSTQWTPGWRGESEIALLDSIFSARAPYGGPGSGVRAVLDRWRAHRGETEPDDLTFLSEMVDEPDLLEQILSNRQRVPGNSRTKSAAAAFAARTLTEVGIATSADFETATEEQRTAFCDIPGLGETTWECILIHLGIRTDAAAAHLQRFVDDALVPLYGDDAEARPEQERARSVLRAVAIALDADPDSVEHAVWRYQHKQRPARKRAQSDLLEA